MRELIKMNKGEWSEAYTFLKLLAEGKLYAADKNLEKLDAIYYPLIKIITEEDNGDLEFIRDGNIKVVNSEDEILIQMEISEFISNASSLVDSIRNERGTFGNREVQDFLTSIGHKKLKSNATNKRDITIVVHDIHTGRNAKLGFSIKSQLGNPSTLLNASGATNFIYKVQTDGSKDIELRNVNSIVGASKIINRVKKIYDLGCSLEYKTISNDNFLCNLQIIDSNLPQIFSYLLVYRYKYEIAKVTDLLDKIEEKNPLKYNLEINKEFYRYKVKRFLMDVALGMRPTDVWSGEFDATGGYIVVKSNGELVCYHIYNINEFQEYLLMNTKFDTPSSRNNFGGVYENSNAFWLNLNLQIRFV